MKSESPSQIPIGPRLLEVRKIIEREYAAPWTLQRLLRRVRLPRFAFQSAYMRAYGCTPMDHLRHVRAREGAKLLDEGRAICDAALLVGYVNERAFVADYRRVHRDDAARLRLLGD